MKKSKHLRAILAKFGLLKWRSRNRVFKCKIQDFRPRVPKGCLLIVAAFGITLKLTQQVSKHCRQTRRFSELRKGQRTLIVHRNQDLLDTPKLF